MFIAVPDEDDGREPMLLDGSKPALRPCRYCGSAKGWLDVPKGPHGNGVRCFDCFRHLGWLPKPPGQNESLFEE